MQPFNHNEHIDLASTQGKMAVTIGTRRLLAVDPVKQEVVRSLTDEYLEISVEGGASFFRFPAADVEDLAAALTEALVGWRTLRARDRQPAEVSGRTLGEAQNDSHDLSAFET